MLISVVSLKRFQEEMELQNPDAVISIVNPTTDNPEVGKEIPTLKMKFHDICFEIKSYHGQERYTPPSRDHVDEIFHFGAFKYKKGTKLLTHCFAGISRSSAAAIIALCPHYGYVEAVRMVSEIDVYQSEGLYEKGSLWFMPNNLMIQYADERLALDGALVRLVEETFAY
jgi:predicted protein tyrosine phosphatase